MYVPYGIYQLIILLYQAFIVDYSKRAERQEANRSRTWSESNPQSISNNWQLTISIVDSGELRVFQNSRVKKRSIFSIWCQNKYIKKQII